MATSLQQPSLYNGHLSTIATFLQWPPLYNGHLSTMATSLQQPSLYKGHLSTMATFLQWPPHCHGHLSITTTSLQRPPFYDSHFSLQTVSTFTLVSTSLQWPLSSVPKLAVVETFNCSRKGTRGQVSKALWNFSNYQ